LKPVRKRKLIDEMRGDWAVSIRRACRVFLFDTSTYHYKSRRPEQAPLEQRIKEICQTRVRYGYRRVHIVLRPEGWRINQKKTRRIYREMGLQLTQQNAQAPGQSQAAGRPLPGSPTERDLGDGLCA
jgi:putative transposase